MLAARSCPGAGLPFLFRSWRRLAQYNRIGQSLLITKSSSSLGVLFVATAGAGAKDAGVIMSMSTSTKNEIPRAAVSIVVRYNETTYNYDEDDENGNKNENEISSAHDEQVSPQPPPAPKYLLVQRGKEPNKGQWSLPGGKIEWGESTLAAARRELDEETTGWPTSQGLLYWHDETFTSSDSIGEGYHYLIAHSFAEWKYSSSSTSSSSANNKDYDATLLQEQQPECIQPPPLKPADDSADVDWFTLSHIRANSHNITPGVVRVIERTEALYEHGLLSTCVHR